MLVGVLVITLIMLIFAVIKGIFVGFPLVLSLFMFMALAVQKGFKPKVVLQMSLNGARKALIVLQIFVLIGAITGAWMVSGTVPSLVYYGALLMNPKWFLLFAFLICSLVSMMLGTAFGTVGTVGLAFMLMAKSGDANLAMTAGAIISGAYFGDRSSPMSSSANLVAHLTGTELYDNIKNMMLTALIPLILSVFFFGYLSMKQNFTAFDLTMNQNITSTFYVSWITVTPAILILILAILKLPVKKSMLASIILAAFIALALQHKNPLELLRAIALGFNLPSDNPLASIIGGGGIISMWKAAVVVTTSSALAGIFEGTQLLSAVEKNIQQATSRLSIFATTVVVSALNCAIGCNQSIAIIMTEQLMRQTYKNGNLSKSQLAVDIENTGVVIAALTPWNIAAFVPTSTLGLDPYSYLPYAFYIYSIVIVAFIWAALNSKFKIKRHLFHSGQE